MLVNGPTNTTRKYLRHCSVLIVSNPKEKSPQPSFIRNDWGVPSETFVKHKILPRSSISPVAVILPLVVSGAIFRGKCFPNWCLN